MKIMDLGVASLRYIGWEPFTGIGENEVRSGTEWAKLENLNDFSSVVCSADSVIVIEVRWHCLICRLSKVEPRIYPSLQVQRRFFVFYQVFLKFKRNLRRLQGFYGII